MIYRRKPHDLKMQIDEYSGHLKRIQNMMEHSSSPYRKDNKDTKKIIELIENSKKIHSYGRRKENIERNKIQQLFKKNDYQRVKSVVKDQITKELLSIPQKHKKNNQSIEKENEKLLQRLLYVRSQLGVNRQILERSKQKSVQKLPNVHNLDLTKIYEQSKLSITNQEHTIIKIGKNKNLKIEICFNTGNISQFFKQNNALYAIQAYYDHHNRCQNQLSEKLFKNNLTLYINRNPNRNLITLKVIRVSQDKEIVRGVFTIDLAELISHPDNSKLMETKLKCSKGQKLGNISFNIKLFQIKRGIGRKTTLREQKYRDKLQQSLN